MELHKKIAITRKSIGLTQEKLADLTNITVRTIQRIESGKSSPRTFTIKIIAEALGTTFEQLTHESQNHDSLKESTIPEIISDLENEKHFLKILCLSCFGYLVIPLVHFLIPIYLLKKSGSYNTQTIAFGRSVIRQQIYWGITLSFSLLLALAYNFIVVTYFKEFYLLHYLWIFFIMYILNALLITVSFLRIKTINF
ncbi:Helix-turn-helix [Pedobacter steynii]|uniref:Helix-turn-helix n=1 Tax=Pedobacter steynii TaxID=430522 RepID=A0A1H0JT95_9SPHI|nr:helix-turn-helix transcriptional regulator [Pedobacter steynii]NQX43157.1 helix-turn-helix transcriptional regulator [Pedobacter steynii]SDO46966.1 Helix-turn-helix [Pedobacter steynii]